MNMGIPKTIHELKTWPEQFELTNCGEKTLELRREDDKKFQPRDLLWLREYVPTDDEWHARFGDEPNPYADWIEVDPGTFTGEECWVWVSDVIRGWGLLPGWAALSVKRVQLVAS